MLLAIETATSVCSVALVREGDVVGLVETAEPRQHAAQLVPLIGELLDDQNLRPAELDAVAVSAGPGSYTGLRIGASTAKGLAWTHDLELVAVPSLDALAHAASHHLEAGEHLVTAFTSRRGEAYVALHCNTGRTAAVQHAAALRLDELEAWLPPDLDSVTVAGEAAEAVADAMSIATRVLDASAVRPSAASVGILGWSRWCDGDTEDVAAFEPAYLKAFVAERGGSIFDRLPR